MNASSEARRTGGALVMQGVVAILFGAAAAFWPGLTLVTLVYLFSAFVLASGLVNVVVGLGQVQRMGGIMPVRLLTIILGIAQVAVGVYLLRHPGVSFATFILLIGFTLLAWGVFQIIGGLFDAGTATMRTSLVIVGLLSALAGIVVLFQPAASGVAFVWILGVYALITGPLDIAMALDVMNAPDRVEARARR